MRNIFFSKLKGEKNPFLIKFNAYSLYCMSMMHFRREVQWKVLLFASPEATSIDFNKHVLFQLCRYKCKTNTHLHRKISCNNIRIVIIIWYYKTIIELTWLVQISQDLLGHCPNFSRGAGNNKNGEIGATWLRYTPCIRKTPWELGVNCLRSRLSWGIRVWQWGWSRAAAELSTGVLELRRHHFFFQFL